MNRRQKAILVKFVTVIVMTALAVTAIAGFRDYVNRAEATRAMEHLSRVVQKYRTDHGRIPPEPYIDSIKDQLHGHIRVGGLEYRARWIDIESAPDTILAYTRQNYSSWLVGSGVIVLTLDGRVQWMSIQNFEQLMAVQHPEQLE